MNTKELVHIAFQMEKCIENRSYGDVLTLLSDLDKVKITAEQLETTDTVKVLYRLLKSCSDKTFKKTVKSLLAKWKKQYGKDRDVKCPKEDKVPECSCGDSLLNICEKGVSEPGKNFLGDEDSHQTLPLTSESNSSPCPSSVRSKGVQLLLAALSKGVPNQEKAANLAAKIEEHIHKLHKLNNTKYKACLRSKVANLRNPKNGHLLTGLLNGSLPPEIFAEMSAVEMASEELRQLREEYSSQGVSERQLPQGIEGTKTQKIKCKRCGGSDCRVTQVSRGALFLPAWVRRGGPDEDAMTFVTCSGCGQQWYHSGWICL